MDAEKLNENTITVMLKKYDTETQLHFMRAWAIDYEYLKEYEGTPLGAIVAELNEQLQEEIEEAKKRGERGLSPDEFKAMSESAFEKYGEDHEETKDVQLLVFGKEIERLAKEKYKDEDYSNFQQGKIVAFKEIFIEILTSIYVELKSFSNGILTEEQINELEEKIFQRIKKRIDITRST